MRVVCPFVPGFLHPLTSAALGLFAPQAEHVDVSANPSAYWRLLRRLWGEGVGWVNVEHDIEIRSDTIPQFEVCDRPWCVAPYNGGGIGQPGDPLLYESLGCARFSADLLGAVPDLMDRVGGHTDTLASKDWRRLDTLVAHHLRTAGVDCHVQAPVAHHHVYGGRCACGGTH